MFCDSIYNGIYFLESNLLPSTHKLFFFISKDQ